VLKRLFVTPLASVLLGGGIMLSTQLLASENRDANTIVPVTIEESSPETIDLDKDTPETVMQAGKNGVEGLNGYLQTLRELQAVHNRIATDKSHATKVLELARKNDRSGLAALFKKDAPSTQVEVTDVKDFTVTATYKRADGSTVIVCVSNSLGCSNRRSFVLII
jgi:hypothetical protein